MGISPDEDLTSYVHVAHGLEVSSQTNINSKYYNLSSTSYIDLPITIITAIRVSLSCLEMVSKTSNGGISTVASTDATNTTPSAAYKQLQLSN
jgi:hypothetical protein